MTAIKAPFKIRVGSLSYGFISRRPEGVELVAGVPDGLQPGDEVLVVEEDGLGFETGQSVTRWLRGIMRADEVRIAVGFALLHLDAKRFS
jgi:hypothetical protein